MEITNVAIDEANNRIALNMNGRAHYATYSNFLREFAIRNMQGTVVRTTLTLPNVVVSRGNITIADTLPYVDEEPYTYVKCSDGLYSVLFRGQVQPTGAAFFNDLGDLEEYVIKGVKELNKVHKNGTHMAVIERPGRTPTAWYIDREKGIVK